MKETNDKFYRELDEHRAHASCCTCQSMVLFFGIVLIIAIISVIYLFWRFNAEKNKIIKLPQKISGDLLSNKFNLDTTNPDQLQIPVSENDLTKILSSGFNLDNFLLKNIQVFISDKEILIHGISSPIKSKVVINAIPKVQDGKIFMEVTSVKTDKLQWPSFLATNLSGNISDFLNQKIWLIYQTINVDSVQLKEGQMLIKGKIK